MKYLRILLVSLLALSQFSCTPQSAGGTTDTGNAKVALIVQTTDGSPAAHATVIACPTAYHSGITADSGATRAKSVVLLTTNDTGYCALDTLARGQWSIEINDKTKNATHLITSFDTSADSLFRIDATLHPYARINGSVGALADTAIQRFLVIDGLERRIPVGSDGSFTADGLPSGTFSCSVLSPQPSWKTLVIDSVKLLPGALFSIDTAAIDTTVITLNTTTGGAAISEDIYHLPLLIRLNGSTFNFDDDNLDSSNLHVVKKNGNECAMHFEQWDPRNQTALLWVCVDTLQGNSATQKLFLLKGNKLSLANKSGQTPFDTADGFLGIYHFNGSVKNSAINLYNGIDSGTVDTASGSIGRARAFNGKSQFITISELPERPSGTISYWMRPKKTINSSMSTTQGIWGKKTDDNHDYSMSFIGTDFYAGTSDNGSAECKSGDIIGKLETDKAGTYVSSTSSGFTEGTWYYVVFTWNPQRNSLYINGALEDSIATSVGLAGTAQEYIGRNSYDTKNIKDGPTLYFNGTLDEFRIESTCRTASWIKLCYMNQLGDDKFVTITKSKYVH